jgi:hypothetical protein
MARHANDPLDRRATLAEIQDRYGCFLPTQITFILETFRVGEKLWIDYRRSDRGSDRPHRFTDGDQERRAGILHEVPAVSDLDDVRKRLRSSFPIPATTITRHDFDGRMASEPGLNRRDLTIRQKGNYLPTLEIADNRSVAVIATESPIIDAHHAQWLCPRAGAAPHDA